MGVGAILAFLVVVVLIGLLAWYLKRRGDTSRSPDGRSEVEYKRRDNFHDQG